MSSNESLTNDASQLSGNPASTSISDTSFILSSISYSSAGGEYELGNDLEVLLRSASKASCTALPEQGLKHVFIVGLCANKILKAAIKPWRIMSLCHRI